MWFRRIGLFLLTNLAVLVLVGIGARVLGLDLYLARSGSSLDLRALLVFSALFGFLGSFVSLALSKVIARWSTRARVLREPRTQQEAWLLATVARQAAQVGIGVPEVAVYPSPDLNAFATGARRDHALVAVSEGLLAHMPRREVEAVLAHEISHVANGDMVTMSLLQGVLNTFVIFLSRVVGFFVDRVLLRSSDEGGRSGPGYWITVIALEIAFGLLASLVVSAYSRRREFGADAGAARLVGRDAMISALETLGSVRAPALLPKGLKAFGIRGGGVVRLLASHPPIEARIERLRQMG
jgi:heat shock protein HtpX